MMLIVIIVLATTSIVFLYSSRQANIYLNSCTEELQETYIDCYGGIPYEENGENHVEPPGNSTINPNETEEETW